MKITENIEYAGVADIISPLHTDHVVNVPSAVVLPLYVQNRA